MSNISQHLIDAMSHNERASMYAKYIASRDDLRPVLDWRDRKYSVMRGYLSKEISLRFKAHSGREMPSGTFDLENARRLAVEILRACDDIDSNATRIEAKAKGESNE